MGIVLIAGGVFASGLNKTQTPSFPKESLIQMDKLISVDVSGAVVKPGVYEIKDGSRIEDAVLAAGGFANSSNKEYISKYINMAQKLSDGSKVYVPFEGEQTGGAQGGSVVAGTVAASAKVNINTATQAELEALPGIGPVTASKIISDRPYNKVEDLLNKKIVNKTVYEKIKDSVSLY